MKNLSSEYLSSFCMELRLLIRAELEPEIGLEYIYGSKGDKLSKALIKFLKSPERDRMSLSDKLESFGSFPRHFISYLRLGEASGKLDEALLSLSQYYERKSRLAKALQKSLLYPLLMIIAAAAIVIVLITKVLPIFNEIFELLDTELSPYVVSLINAGRWLISAQAIILALLTLTIVVVILILIVPRLRHSASRSLSDRGIFGQISASNFTSAMSAALSSGLDPTEAVTLAEDLCRSSRTLCTKISKCREFIGDGDDYVLCLRKAGLISDQDSRRLELGKSVGVSQNVIAELAKRSEEKLDKELERRLDRFAPIIVISICAFVGVTLVSVMLPLIGILSSL